MGATSANPSTDTPTTPAPAVDTSSSPTSASPSIPTATRSQQIAQGVLAGSVSEVPNISTSNPGTGAHSAEMTKLAAALSGGKGVHGNPLYVTLSERKILK
jgi:hypothetical protein